MTSPEKIEEILNKFGQTISNLPKIKDFKNYGNRDELLNRMISAGKNAEEWFNPDNTGEYYEEALPAFICHQSDVIERLVNALEVAEKVASCDFCKKHEDKCSSSSKFECEGFELEEQDV